MRIGNDSFIEDGTATDMSVTITSTPVWLGHICNYAIQLVFTGSPVGSFKLQASNDEGNPASAPTEQYKGVVNWTDIIDSPQAIGAAGNHMYTVEDAGYRWVRFIWTPSSGSATLTIARFNVKGV